MVAPRSDLVIDHPPAGPLAPPARRPPPSGLIDDIRVVPALRLIDECPAADLDLETLAAAAGLSPFHFHRRFLATMGETAGDYVRRTRLDRAAIWLCFGERPVNVVAEAAGYASHEAFARAFQRQFGMPPRRYRALAQGAIQAPLRADHARAALVRPVRLMERPLIAARFVGCYAEVMAFWLSFARMLQAIRFPLEQARPVAIVRDSAEITPTGLIRYDCAVIDTGFPAGLVRPPLMQVALKAGRYALLAHDQPYAEIFSAWRTVCSAWIPGSGETISDSRPAYELWRRPPWELSDGPQQLQVAVPLQSM